jgi:NitT/TauT family transport system permease protein
MNDRLIRIASVCTFLLLWEAVSRAEVVPKFLLVPPSVVATSLMSMLGDGTLMPNILASMGRVLVGYGLAVVAGITLGMLMGWFSVVDSVLDPIVELVRPVSPLAILPLSMLWFGIGEPSKYFVICYGCFFPILINTFVGVRGIPKSTVEAARTLGANTWELLVKVILKSGLPMMLAGARISFAVGMIVMVAAEMINADRGLGYMILTAQQTFNTINLYVGIVTIAIIGFIGDRVIRLLRKLLCPWYVESSGSTPST